MPFRIFKFDVPDTTSNFMLALQEYFFGSDFFVIIKNRQTSAKATERARLWPEKYIILTRYKYKHFPEIALSFSEILDRYENFDHVKDEMYHEGQEPLDRPLEYAVILLEMDKETAKAIWDEFDASFNDLLDTHNAIDYADELFVSAAALDNEGLKILYGLFDHIMTVYPSTMMTLLPEMGPEYQYGEIEQQNKPLQPPAKQQPPQNSGVRRVPLDTTWYFSEGTNVFMGIAQDYFKRQEAGFLRRNEIPHFEVNLLQLLGKDESGVNELAVLSYNRFGGRSEVWVNAVKRPGTSGCKITITEINQGWIYIEQRWNEFIDYLSDEGWKINTEQPKVINSPKAPPAYSQLQPEYDGAGMITMETLKRYFPNASERELEELQKAQRFWDVLRLEYDRVKGRDDGLPRTTFYRRKKQLEEHNLLKRKTKRKRE